MVSSLSVELATQTMISKRSHAGPWPDAGGPPMAEEHVRLTTVRDTERDPPTASSTSTGSRAAKAKAD